MHKSISMCDRSHNISSPLISLVCGKDFSTGVAHNEYEKYLEVKLASIIPE